MAENKNSQLMVNIEPTFFDLARKASEKYDMSLSGYVRQLIINDLIKQEILTQSIIESVLVGPRRI